MKPWMSEHEIMRLYGEASSPRKQIGILAELNNCPVKTIIETLNRNGIEVKINENKRKSTRITWDVDKCLRVLREIERGISLQKIAEMFNCSDKTIYCMVEKMGGKWQKPSKAMIQAIEIFNAQKNSPNRNRDC